MRTFKIMSAIRGNGTAQLITFDAEEFSVSDYGVVRFYVNTRAVRRTSAVYKLDAGQYVV